MPNGPRTPITVPGPAPCSAPLTAPTSRIVCTSTPSPRSGRPLSDIATSPTPKAYSIMNWPGRGAGSGAASGRSRSVAQSSVSGTRAATS